ncbi:uncharacterized protein Dana_GF24186 [Drosophila ananassae]|uniref:CHK kinase-like domain-containing protein n=1 Tax=Drosophila ananassae TaxID=7217 RepID=B3MU60_DROAN|nr:uncharacterized protein LOC6506819 [Drosophila ananassae]EDV33389.1 uncharacterized protein Dana_GF24186 [Drosophila ananassae]
MSTEEYNPILTRKNRLELFTLDECKEILANLLADKKQSGVLTNFEIVPASEHVGFLGEYFHLHLRYQLEDQQDEQITRLFVKSVIFQNANMEFYMEKMGIIKKEIKLYELLNKLKKFSPHLWCAKCYFTRDDLFVMENVEDLGYVALPSGTSFLNKDQLQPILKSLATLHASSIAFEKQEGKTIGVELREWLKEVSVDPDVEWYTTGLNAVLAIAATHPDVRNNPQALEYVKKELPRCLDRVYYMVNPSPVHRNVFVHRDAWGANVFYHKDQPQEKRSILVDFQLCRYSPPAMDFHLVSYLNLEPSNRKIMLRDLIDIYYETLSEELEQMGIDPKKENLSKGEFIQSLEDFSLFGLTYNCIAATILRLPDNFLKNLKDESPGDFHRFCNVNRTEDVLRLMKDYPEFADYMYECVGDLLELTYNKLN